MGSADEVEVGALQELGDDVGPEGERHTAVALPPPLGVRVRVRPQHIAQQALVRHFRRALDVAQLLELCEGGGEAAVHADDLLLDHRDERQAVERVAELLPQLDAIPLLALCANGHTLVKKSDKPKEGV